MIKIALLATLLAVVTVSAAAQTAEELEAEPLVKLQPGETPVPGECLTKEELDLIKDLTALKRPTVGVEGEGDDQPPVNPHYLIGTWEIEGVLRESPLGESGEFLGTETIRHVEGCTYESTMEATIPDGPVTVTALMVYDRRARYLVRLEQDSRGLQLLNTGRVGGDAGGYFSHHWEAPRFTLNGKVVRLKGHGPFASPVTQRLRMQISVDGEPFTNFGTLWRQRKDALR